jgi:germination protein M
MAVFFAIVYAGEYLIPGGKKNTVAPDDTGFLSTGQTSSVISDSTVEVVLYFTDEDFSGLVAEKRLIEKHHNVLESVLQELLRGPKLSSHYNPLPESTRLNGVFTESGIVYVDLSHEMKDGQSGGTTQELLSIFSIVDTLTSLPDVKRIKILIDGKEETTLCGHIDISEPLERDEKLIAEIQ